MTIFAFARSIESLEWEFEFRSTASPFTCYVGIWQIFPCAGAKRPGDVGGVLHRMTAATTNSSSLTAKFQIQGAINCKEKRLFAQFHKFEGIWNTEAWCNLWIFDKWIQTTGDAL